MTDFEGLLQKLLGKNVCISYTDINNQDNNVIYGKLREVNKDYLMIEGIITNYYINRKASVLTTIITRSEETKNET